MTALSGYDYRDPFSLDEEVDYMGATRRSIKGMKIAYSPNFDVYPVDKRVTDVVGKAVKAFEEAGAHVEEVSVGIKRSQQELGDLWCRLIIPLSVAACENFKLHGIDLLKDHRDDLPPEYLDWLERAYKWSVLDIIRDQEMRTEVYDPIQSLLENTIS